MGYKFYNLKQFFAKAEGRTWRFDCASQKTRYGFRHVCSFREPWSETRKQASCLYYNRTWERFEYESVLKSAIKKCPKDVQDELLEQIVRRNSAEEHEKVEKELAEFKELYDKQTPGMKAALSKVTLTDQKGADFVTGIMKSALIMNAVSGKTLPKQEGGEDGQRNDAVHD